MKLFAFFLITLFAFVGCGQEALEQRLQSEVDKNVQILEQKKQEALDQAKKEANDRANKFIDDQFDQAKQNVKNKVGVQNPAN